MSLLKRRTLAVSLVAMLSVLVAPATSRAGGPGTWTKLATVDNTFDTVGMLRTANGDLHLVYLEKKLSTGKFNYGAVTLSLDGKVISTGTTFSPPWDNLDTSPQLVKNGSGLRLVFIGSTGSSGCFSHSLVYTATSSNGSTWVLAKNVSMSFHSAGIGSPAATAEKDGATPVATFAGGTLYHVGLDNCPASRQDGTITPVDNGTAFNPAIATDPKAGSVWVAWDQFFNKPGYWVNEIFPSQPSPKEAPSSDDSSPKQDNEPRQPVAIVGRGGGGVYMAYCVATSSKQCAHIDLWKVGTSTPLVVPDSSTGNAKHVALAAGLQGRLTVLWYDSGQNLIHAVRTNTTATGFGVDRTIKPPTPVLSVDDLQAEGTFGRLDVVAVIQSSNSGLPINVWQTQILAGLSLTASPNKFSHTTATTVTFTVKDAGQPVAGATVSCIGKSGKTGSTGQVKISYPKGTATGKHVCTAAKADYNVGKTTITVT